MVSFLFVTAWLTGGGLACQVDPSGEPAPAQSYPEVLAEVGDLDRLWTPPRSGERGLQFSSYDRRSTAGPGDLEAWHANDDRGNYLRVDERGARREFVLVDQAGPGVITRLWSANPAGTLRLYLDGGSEPTWEVGFADLLGGRLDGLGAPLCGVRAGGGNCYLPIPFAKRIVVTADRSDLYYHVGVSTRPADRPVESFDPRLLREHRRAIARCSARLASASLAVAAVECESNEVAVEQAALDTSSGGAAASQPVEPATLWKFERSGSGVVRVLRLGVEFPGIADDVSARSLRVVVEVDGERSVDVPFGDFFGCMRSDAQWSGRALGRLSDGTGYCLFPMPFVDSLRIALRTADPRLFRGTVRHAVQVADAGAGFSAEPLRFRATWHQQRELATRPRPDHAVLDARGGAGRFVGCGLVVRNPSRAWWGEGDERIFVDGEPFPSTFGTGTEDYFGYAWCSPQQFDHPLHAQPIRDGVGSFGLAHNVRLQLADAVPFQASMRFDFEVWHWDAAARVDYATTAWWYGARGVGSGLPEVPAFEGRELAQVSAPPAPRVVGVLEGEALEVRSHSGGSHSIQNMGEFTRGGRRRRWSGGAHLWWIDAKPGDRLELAVPVPEAGNYRVEAVFTTARDYGRARFSLAGRALGGELEFYTRDVRNTGVVTLGEVRLEQGVHSLIAEITGHHRQAIARHMIGIDYVRLVPLRD